METDAPLCGSCHQALTEGRAPDVAPPRQDISGDRRVVTVVVLRLDDLAGQAADLDPEDARTLLDRIYSALVPRVARYEGMAGPIVGDVLTAWFGAPLAHEDDARRAIQAAWELRAVAGDLHRQIAELTAPLAIRIGIDTRLVVAGEVSLSPRNEYAISPDGSKRAFHLAAEARDGDIWASAATRAVRSGFEFEKVETESGLDAYRVLAPDPARRAHESPLIGRKGELLRLHGACLCALEHRPQLIVMEGEAGLGKTSLAATLARAWRGRMGGSLLRGEASALDSRPLALVASLLADCARTLGAEGLSGRLARLLPLAPELAVGLLGPFFGLPSHPTAAAMAPESRQEARFGLMTELLIDLAREAPLLVILDDLQELGDASRRWLEHFLAALGGGVELPVAVLCLTRPLERALAPVSGVDFTGIRLRELPQGEALALVRQRLGVDGPWSDALAHLAARIVERAEGNPLYVEELAGAIVHRGAVVAGEGRFDLAGPAEPVLPDSLIALVASRLDRLSGLARSVAQKAAVVGRRFDLATLDPLLGPEREQGQGRFNVRRPLEELVHAGVIASVGLQTFAFCQEVAWEAAYQGLLIRTRRELHQRVAEALQMALDTASSLEDASQVSAQIAHHRVQAGAPLEAAVACLAAGQAFLRVSANTQARRFLLMALAELDRAGEGHERIRAAALLDLARVEAVLGDYDTALARLEARAVLVAEDPEGLLGQADILQRQGHHDGALADLGRVVEAADCAPLQRTRALSAMATILLRMGEYERALARADQVIAVLGDLGEPRERATVASIRGSCLLRIGDLEAARQEHLAALALREQEADLEGVAKSLLNLGTQATMVGTWGQARDYYSRSLALFRTLGDKRHVSMLLANLGSLVLGQGDIELADRHFREALKMARAIGDLMGVSGALANLGEVALARQDGAAALDPLDECLGLIARTGLNEYACDIHHLRGRALALCKDVAAAREELEQARALAARVGNEAQIGVVDTALAELALDAGDREEALALAEAAVRTLRDADRRLDLGRALLVVERADPVGGSRLEEAIEIFEQLGARLDLARARKLRLQAGGAGDPAPSATERSDHGGDRGRRDEIPDLPGGERSAR